MALAYVCIKRKGLGEQYCKKPIYRLFRPFYGLHLQNTRIYIWAKTPTLTLCLTRFSPLARPELSVIPRSVCAGSRA